MCNCLLDICRADAAAAAAASGTQLAPGMSAGETDVTEPAKLLVTTVKALKVSDCTRPYLQVAPVRLQECVRVQCMLVMHAGTRCIHTLSAFSS
jgi:hypothetical protein